MQHPSDQRVWVATDRPGEQIALAKPLPGIALMSGRSSDRNWIEHHSEFDLCLISPLKEGVACHYKCRGSHVAAAGELMAFEPGDLHVTKRVAGGKGDFDVVRIAPRELELAARELGFRGAFHFRSPQLRCAEVARALEQFVAQVSSAAPRFELECSRATLLHLLIERCAETPHEARPHDTLGQGGVRVAREYLHEHFREEPSLDALATLSGLSRFAFEQAFEREVGVPAYDYVQLRRAAEARKLIERDMPLSNTARVLGYTDVAQLKRALKAYCGMSPARWRRCLRGNLVSS